MSFYYIYKKNYKIFFPIQSNATRTISYTNYYTHLDFPKTNTFPNIQTTTFKPQPSSPNYQYPFLSLWALVLCAMTVSPPMALLSIPISTTLIFFFFFTSSITHTQSASNHTCPSYPNCGDIQIHYPFWLNSSTTTTTTTTTNTSYCGYPGFGLTCNQSSNIKFPILHLPNVDYYAIAIDYNAYTVTLIDIDVYHKQCPRANHNFTFDHSLNFFQYTPNDLNLTFLFNCSNPFRDFLQPTTPLSCLQNSYVFPEDVFSKGIGWHSYCSEAVMLPALSDYVNVSDLPNNFGEVLNNGFELNWYHASDCGACEESGGSCFYDNKQGNYAGCLCGDVFQAHKCTGKGLSTAIKALIGVSSVVGVSLFALVIFLFCHYKKRKSLPTNTSNLLFSRSISSDPSSKTDPELGSALYPAHIFSYSELQEATNNFNASQELGDGGFGTVYKGKLRDGRTVAVKRLYENNYKRVEQFMNEVAILNRLRHTNLVSLYGCTSRHSRELLLVYEYVPNGTVADHLHGDHPAHKKPLTWPVRMSIAIETAEALKYLHMIEPPIIHRDVKTNNILLDSNFHVKVADFGLSRLFPMDATHVSTAPQGTPGYVDPEYYQCYQLTDKSDVYSFGVVLVELISSMPAVDITRRPREINLASMAISKIHSNSLHELVDPNLGFDSDCEVKRMVTAVGELAFRCLQAEKEMRPCMDEVLEALKGIMSFGGGEETDVVTPIDDDVRLLKNNNQPLGSPVSVADHHWESRSTTPNTSG
ncbi:putative serine/threonine-protein kinase [Acorus calamus]|uniref:non-specific serine/threonine protein kinase n=1 Tax=Acorus calamus TaxID=4465 RepID=A0AAV9DSG4_ACOCL|nr:putative serine/threonine-protein kinase [Acorus calamus]